MDDGFDGPDVSFPDGYSAVFAPLAANLEIQLNSAVADIHLTRSGIKVTAATGDYEADAVVVTVPPTVLASGKIDFPSVADDHLNAAARIPLGVFEKPFWTPNADWHNLVGFDPQHWASWFSPRHHQANTLIGFNGGDIAREYEAADPAPKFKQQLCWLSAICMAAAYLIRLRP